MKAFFVLAGLLLGPTVFAATLPVTAPASQPATQQAKSDTPERAWNAVLAAMLAGDKKALAGVTTDGGYKALAFKKDKEKTADQLKADAQRWSACEFHLTQPNPTTASANIVRPQVEGGFWIDLVHTPDGWKIDGLRIGE